MTVATASDRPGAKENAFKSSDASANVSKTY